MRVNRSSKYAFQVALAGLVSAIFDPFGTRVQEDGRGKAIS